MLSLSVVIPTRNEEANLKRCLESLIAQNVQDIIVVDNQSSDSTTAIARTYKARLLPAGRERSQQRNLGAQIARGSYLLFIDADMEPQKGLISELENMACRKIKAAIVSEKGSGLGFWSSCRKLEKECYLGDDLIEAVRFIRKDIFFRLGGYDELMVAGEDWELTAKIRAAKIPIIRTKHFLVHNETTNPWLAAKKKYYYGLNLPVYLKKRPGLSSKQFAFFRPAFRRNWRRLSKKPIVTFGLIILKSFEFGGGGAGLLKAKVKTIINQISDITQ